MLLRTKNNKGFTIIEVLIVLAIAAVIITIVLLAVPALQRNSRNTQRRNDVSAAIAAVSEYLNNNSGQYPASAAVAVASAKLGFYDVATEITGTTNGSAAVNSITSTTGLVISNYAKCPTSMPAADTAAVPMGANPTRRNFAAVYRIELSSGFQAQCVDM